MNRAEGLKELQAAMRRGCALELDCITCRLTKDGRNVLEGSYTGVRVSIPCPCRQAANYVGRKVRFIPAAIDEEACVVVARMIIERMEVLA